MELTAVAVAGGFAALSPQCVERGGEERSSFPALFQELRELMLDREQLGAERAELLVHGWGPGGICRSLLILYLREREMFEVRPGKGKKVIPSGEGEGREAGSVVGCLTRGEWEIVGNDEF